MDHFLALRKRFVLIVFTGAAVMFQTAGASDLLTSENAAPREFPLEALNGTLRAGEEVTYTYSEDDDKEYAFDGTINGRVYTGIKFDITPGREGVFEGELTAKVPEGRGSHLYTPNSVTFSISGDETQPVYLTWDDFDRPKTVDAWVTAIKKLSLTGSYADSGSGQVTVRDARLVKGDVITVSCPRRGKMAPADGEVVYEVNVTNLREEPLGVKASFERGGWEAMTSTVEPDFRELAPNATESFEVRVTPTDNRHNR